MTLHLYQTPRGLELRTTPLAEDAVEARRAKDGIV